MITTKRWKIDNVAKHWKNQYYHRGQWKVYAPGNAEHVYIALSALPTGATEEDVVAIIGNNSWIECKCNQCWRDVDAIVSVGEEPDYESRTADLCRDCVLLALMAFEEVAA